MSRLDGFEVSLAPGTEAPAEARRKVESEFGDRMPAWMLHELKVVVTELVSNSVEHGPGRPISLKLDLDADGVVRGEVEDQGSGTVATREIVKDGDRGLGLHLVDFLTTRWGVYEGSTHVWFEKVPWPDRRRGAGPRSQPPDEH